MELEIAPDKDKRRKLYDSLVGKGQKLPDYETFSKDMADPAKVKALHESSLRNGYPVPKDLATFDRDIASDLRQPPFPQPPPQGANLPSPASSTGQPASLGGSSGSASMGTRLDGTPKGSGWLGPIPTRDGQTMTELSFDFDTDGQKVFAPLLVPTLNKEEVDHLAGGGKPTEAIYKKAQDFALQRQAEGKSPFKDEQEPPRMVDDMGDGVMLPGTVDQTIPAQPQLGKQPAQFQPPSTEQFAGWTMEDRRKLLATAKDPGRPVFLEHSQYQNTSDPTGAANVPMQDSRRNYLTEDLMQSLPEHRRKYIETKIAEGKWTDKDAASLEMEAVNRSAAMVDARIADLEEKVKGGYEPSPAEVEDIKAHAQYVSKEAAQDFAAIIKRHPEMVRDAKEDEIKSQVAERMKLVNPQYAYVAEPALRAAAQFGANLLRSPRTFSFNDEYGWTDQLAEHAEEVMDRSRAQQAKSLQGPLVEKNKITGDLKIHAEKVLPKTVETLVSSLMMVGAGGGSAPGLVASSFVQTNADYYKDAMDAGATATKAGEYAASAAALTSALELVSPGNFLWKQKAKDMGRVAVREMAGGKTMSEAWQKAKFVGGESLKEVTQEMSQLSGDKIAASIANQQLKSDNPYFAASLDDEMKPEEVAETVLLTVAMTGLVSGAAVVGRNPLNAEAIKWAVENPDAFVASMNKYGVQPEQQKAAVEKLESYRKAYGGFKETGDPVKDKVIADAVLKKEAIREQQKNSPVDDLVALVQGNKFEEQLKAIDEEMAAEMGVSLVDVARKQEAARLMKEYDKAKVKSEVTGKPMPEGMKRPVDPSPAPTATQADIDAATGVTGVVSENNLVPLQNEGPEQTQGASQAQEVVGGSVPPRAFVVDPTTGGEGFYRAIQDAASKHKLGSAVDVKDQSFYTSPSTKLFMANDATAGVAVTESGDLVSVFKAPGSTANINDLLSEASKDARTLDAFDINGFLPDLYAKHGFVPVARVPFNEEYAPEGWPYDLAGKPDVVLMVRDPNGVLGAASGPYGSVRDAIQSFDDYGDAMEAQSKAAELVAQQTPQQDATQQATGGQPLSSQSLQDAFGYTKEVADATEAIADAMGLDKSKIKVVKGGEAGDGALMQDDVGGWYSRLDQMATAKGNTQSGADWMKWAEARAKEGMLSMEEVKWTGLADFLQGKAKVTPKEVRDFLKENRVKVEVVELSDEPLGYHVDDGDVEDVEDLGYGPWRVTFRGGSEQVVHGDFLNEETAKRLAIEQENEASDDYAGSAPATKFSQYQLPGGTNYREVLVTLPPFVDERVTKYRLFNAAGELDTENIDTREKAERYLRRDAPGGRIEEYAGSVHRSENFRSSHFDEPNILVHLRLNDRVVETPLTEAERADIAERKRMENERDALAPKIREAKRRLDEARKPEEKRIHDEVMEDVKAGRMRLGDARQEILDRQLALSDAETPELKAWRDLNAQWSDLNKRMPAEPKKKQEKILFIEELQSDWGQAGKKKGFADTEAFVAEEAALKKEMLEIPSRFGGTMNMIKAAEQGDKSAIDARERRAEIGIRLRQIEEARGRVPEHGALGGPAPPLAPFVEASDAWVELGIKQAIRMAVDGGYDRIAWTTGEQQYNRWGSQVFSWTKRGDNWYVLGQEQAGGDAFAGMEEQLSEQAFSEGRQIESRDDLRELVLATMGREEKDWSPENWKKHIDKITDGIWQQMKDGKDGSTMPRREGMKGFYDKILPTTVKKVSKKLGGDGNVADVRIPTKVGQNTSMYEVLDGETSVAGPFTRQEAIRYVDENGGDIARIADTTQQSITITPEMRKKVMEGVPLMQGEKASVEFAQSGEAVIRALQNPDASTGVHELAHIARRFLFDKSIPQENRIGITDADIATAEQWSGAKDGKWTREAEEKFARGFERYLRDGNAPNEKLKGVFEKFSQWLRDIYTNLFESPVKEMVSPAMRKVFDNLLSREGKQAPNRPVVKPAPEVEPERVKKTTVGRAYEGEFRREVKSELEKLGLMREVESHDEAEDQAKAIIEKMGIQTALDAVNRNDIKGGARAFIWEAAVLDLQKQAMAAKDPAEISRLFKEQADLLDEMDAEMLSGGRQASAMQRVLARGDAGFSAERMKAKLKKDFGADPSPELEEALGQIEELKAKIKDAEKRAAEAEAQAGADAIRDYVNRQKKKGPIAERKRGGDRIRSFKLGGKGLAFSSVIPTPVIDGAIEVVALTYEAGESLANAIAKGIKHIQKTEWYKKLKNEEQQAAEKAFTDHLKDAERDDVESGYIRVPKKMIRDAVENGAHDIDTLVAVIKEQLQEEYPDATDREIRDAITDYGKVVNMSSDDISKEIRRLRRVGRDISALEDIQAKKRPLRSGLQRDKMDAEERARKKQIREGLKNLPVDAELQAKEIKTALDAAKTRARNRIEDLQREIDTKQKLPRNTKSVEADAELKALIAEKEALQEQHDAIFEDAAATEQERLDRAIETTRRSIEDYEQRIRDSNLDPQKKAPVKETPELKALRAQRDAAKAEYKKLQEDAGVIERKRDKAQQKAIQKAIDALAQRLRDKDFNDKPKKKERVESTEVIDLKADKLRIQEKFDKEYYKHKLANRTTGELAKDIGWEFWGLGRALNASLDASFVGVQGLMMSVSNLWHNPRATANAFKNSWNAMKSEEKSERWIRKVKAQEWYPKAKEAKLALTEAHAQLSAREESFVSEWTRFIWGMAGAPFFVKSKVDGGKAFDNWMALNPFRATERAAVAFLDTLRIERYLDGVEMLKANKEAGKEVTAKDYKDVADVVNTLTGRASLGKAEAMADTLTKLVYSPRLWSSQIKTFTPYGLYWLSKKSPTAQKMAVQDWSRFVGTTLGLVAMAAVYLNNDDDDETKVELDPRSSEYLKIKLGKNIVVDPWGGRLSHVIYTTRALAGAASLVSDKPYNAFKNRKGDILPLGIDHRSPTLLDLTLEVGFNKAAPPLSFLIDAARTTTDMKGNRKTAFGKEYHMDEAALERITPMIGNTVADLMKEEPNAMGVILSATAFFGPVQTYDEDKHPKSKYEQEASDIRSESIQRTKDMTDIIELYEAGTLTKEQADSTFKESFKDLPVEKRKSLVSSYKERLRYVDAPPRVKEILDIENTLVRARMVKDLRETMTEAQKRVFLQELHDAKVITDKFKEEYRALK